MFGHQSDDKDKDQKNNQDNIAVPEPQHDGVLGGDDAISANDDHQNPAFTASAPDVNDDTPADSPSVSLPTATASDDSDKPASPNADELLDIKQQALQQLSPLVDHLDQTPEEKFRTTMMMIQASDNQSLVKTAYEAAKEISDEKARAQALLDIVNEINYFTHGQSKND